MSSSDTRHNFHDRLVPRWYGTNATTIQVWMDVLNVRPALKTFDGDDIWFVHGLDLDVDEELGLVKVLFTGLRLSLDSPKATEDIVRLDLGG